jgi:hypothetical protein
MQIRICIPKACHNWYVAFHIACLTQIQPDLFQEQCKQQWPIFKHKKYNIWLKSTKVCLPVTNLKRNIKSILLYTASHKLTKSSI